MPTETTGENSRRNLGRIYQYMLPAVTQAIRSSAEFGRWLDYHSAQPQTLTLSRRGWLGTGVGLLGLGAGIAAADKLRLKKADGLGEKAVHPDAVGLIGSYKEPFDDKGVNKAIKDLDLTAGSFFKIHESLMPKLKAFLADELFPIFPPSVFQYKDLIYKLSRESGIAPNVIASLITIESAGNPQASSWVGAQGLFQVMPLHFHNIGITDQQKMRDPETNGKVSMKVFNDFLRLSRSIYKNHYPNHPLIYIRALMGYNGGNEAVSTRLSPDESSFYGDHMIRFMLTAEVAARLRKLGMSDQEIVKKLSSHEINARAHALGNYHIRNRPYSYLSYGTYTDALSQPVPWKYADSNLSVTTRDRLHQDYNDYTDNPTSRLPYPASAGLRIWIHLGGRELLEQASLNKDLAAWAKINSKKS